jgi:hypothetical protein
MANMMANEWITSIYLFIYLYLFIVYFSMDGNLKTILRTKAMISPSKV